MNRREKIIIMITILETLSELEAGLLPAGTSPRSHLMLGLGTDYHDHLDIESAMHSAGWVKLTRETIRITNKGRAKLAEIKLIQAQARREENAPPIPDPPVQTELQGV